MESSRYQERAKLYLDKFTGLKTVEPVAVRLVKMINEDTSSLKEFEAVIRADPTLVLRILKLINSSYFSLRTKIKSVSEAIAYIGMDNLRNMIVLDAVKNIFSQDSSTPEFSRKRLWAHCAVTSICCQMVAERIFARKGEDYFLCGILHDTGLIVEDQVAPEKFKTFCRTFSPQTQALTEHEQMVMGTDHTIIGYLLTLKWGMEPDLCRGIKYHHNILNEVEPHSHAGILQIAEYLAARIGYEAFPEIHTRIGSPLLLSHIKENIMEYRAIADDMPQEIQRVREIYALGDDDADESV
ncbi:HDOD domain-containing protein [uncultured Desulfobacter sp.]|uniref:HDOD domain-containing protein n=1 Tax=uncultured Desulfobacter sp. TaxID=240139 RepID=UPI002AAB4185|nr:HDOD domain-containing protein [uncultured Desulfobacter sp.]